jgi:hypothetical protein
MQAIVELLNEIEGAIRRQCRADAEDAVYRLRDFGYRTLPEEAWKPFGIQSMALEASLEMELWSVATEDLDGLRLVVMRSPQNG